MSIFIAEVDATNAISLQTGNPQRLTMEQAQALFQLIEAFRPDWADWKTVMGKLQDVSLHTDLTGHEVLSIVVKAAATQPHLNFEDLDFLRDDEV